MSDFGTSANPKPDPASLERRAQQRIQRVVDDVIGPLHRHGFDEVSIMGVGPVVDRPMPFRGRQHDWLLSSTDQDPIRRRWQETGKRKHRYPMPGEIRRRLQEMSRIYDFADTGVLHELPRGTVLRLTNGQSVPIEALVPPPHPGLEALSQAFDALNDTTSWVTQQAASRAKAAGPVLAGAVAVLTPLIVMGGLAVASVAAAPLMVADPVIFGLVTEDGDRLDDGTQVATYVALAAWEWPVSIRGLQG